VGNGSKREKAPGFTEEFTTTHMELLMLLLNLNAVYMDNISIFSLYLTENVYQLNCKDHLVNAVQEIIALQYANHTKLTNILWSTRHDLLILKQVAHANTSYCN
jgi:hypothetical protein